MMNWGVRGLKIQKKTAPPAYATIIVYPTPKSVIKTKKDLGIDTGKAGCKAVMPRQENELCIGG